MVARNFKEHMPAFKDTGDTHTCESAVTWSAIQTFSAANTHAAKETFSLGFDSTSQTVTPAADSGSGSTITAGVTSVTVAAVTNDANDWIVLPALADVSIGHMIHIACNAGGAFEVRTPATSGEKINNVDSDGTNELAAVDTEIIKIIKVSDTDGWIARSFTLAGATNSALTPN